MRITEYLPEYAFVWVSADEDCRVLPEGGLAIVSHSNAELHCGRKSEPPTKYGLYLFDRTEQQIINEICWFEESRLTLWPGQDLMKAQTLVAAFKDILVPPAGFFQTQPLPTIHPSWCCIGDTCILGPRAENTWVIVTVREEADERDRVFFEDSDGVVKVVSTGIHRHTIPVVEYLKRTANLRDTFYAPSQG